MNLPPGPDETASTNGDLLPWLVRQRESYGDLFRATIDGFTVYVIADPEHAQHVLRANWQNYAKGFGIKRVAFLLGNGLMASEGELWQSQRRMIQPAFHRAAVNALGDAIADANRRLLERWSAAARAGASVNVTGEVSALVLEMVLGALFGADAPRMAASFALLSAAPERDLRFAQAFRGLGKTVLAIAAERRAEGRDAADILGMLLAARDRDTGAAMPEGRLVNESLTLIVAGHETTASVLNWTWYLLAQHPHVEAALGAELDAHDFAGLDDLAHYAYARQVLEEAMRLYPPGWLLSRKALGADRLGPYDVPAGTEMFVSPYLIQRNPAHWPDPGRFDPARFAPGASEDRHPLAMLPFSAGPRNCIGEPLARLEMLLHQVLVARRLRLRFDGDAPPPTLDAGVNLRSRHDFLMRPQLR